MCAFNVCHAHISTMFRTLESEACFGILSAFPRCYSFLDERFLSLRPRNALVQAAAFFSETYKMLEHDTGCQYSRTYLEQIESCQFQNLSSFGCKQPQRFRFSQLKDILLTETRVSIEIRELLWVITAVTIHVQWARVSSVSAWLNRDVCS
jgi:hypothetical protein